MNDISNSVRPKTFWSMRMKNDSTCHPKKMLMSTFNDPILLWCVDTRSLTMDALRCIEIFQKKLQDIIRSDGLYSNVKLSLNEFNKRYN